MAVNNALTPAAPRNLATLTAADRDRIATALAASVSPNTAATYRSRWTHWTAWADSRAVSPLPAEPSTVAAYLAELAETKTIATVKVARAAIRKAHALHGHADPTAHDLVAQSLRGLTRTAKVSGRGPATTVTYDQILSAQALAMQPRKRGRGHELSHIAHRRGLEDQAILGIGFMGGLRRSEIAALAWADLADQGEGEGIAVTVRRSKTNQDGAKLDVRYVKNGSADAIRKLRALRAESGTANDEDSVFALTGDAIGDRIKAALAHAGIDARGVSAHSLRRAHATELAMRGASIADICQSGGWASPAMPVRYASGIAAANNAVARYL